MLIGEEPEVRPPSSACSPYLRQLSERHNKGADKDVAYGPTPECEACTTLAAGAQRVTKPHSDECRAPMEELMQ